MMSNSLFKGTNIFDKLNHSKYGDVMTVLDDLALKSYDDFPDKIPEILVVGNQSSGKSSLLENITKCPFFPKNAQTCTRCPLIITTRPCHKDSEPQIFWEDKNENCEIGSYEDLQGYLCDAMTKIDGFSKDPIYITIIDYDIPECTFIDLPGIVAYPESDAQFTENLVLEYMNRPNILILCVVSGTIQSLNSYVPLGNIKKHNKESNTIVVVTMCDRIQTVDVQNLLIDKLTVWDSDKYLKIVGVINRRDEKVDLISHDKDEQKWFNSHVIKKYGSEYSNVLGINALINVISDFFNVITIENRIPDMLELIEEEIYHLKNKFDNLGNIAFSNEEEEEIKDYFYHYLYSIHFETNNNNSMQYICDDLNKHYSKKDWIDTYINKSINSESLKMGILNDFIIKNISINVGKCIINTIYNHLKTLLPLLCSKENKFGSKKLYRYTNHFEYTFASTLQYEESIISLVYYSLNSNPLIIFTSKEEFIKTLTSNKGFKEALSETLKFISTTFNLKLTDIHEDEEYRTERLQLKNNMYRYIKARDILNEMLCNKDLEDI